MFADNSGGKFINEYEGIENARLAEPITPEEAVAKLAELVRPVIEVIAETITPLIKTIAEMLPPILEKIGDAMAQIIELYPNKRVVHLAKHAKKERVRKKNINRIIEWYERGGR